MVLKSRLPQLIGHLSQTSPSPALRIASFNSQFRCNDGYSSVTRQIMQKGHYEKVLVQNEIEQVLHFFLLLKMKNTSYL